MPVSYTSRFWELRADGRIFIVKEFYPGLEDNPLFPTLPKQEASALYYLESIGLAPSLEAAFESPDGNPMVIYGYEPAGSDEIDVREAGKLLVNLASQVIATKEFQKVPAGALDVLAQADNILTRIPESRRAANLIKLRPSESDFGNDRIDFEPTLVHRSLCLGTVLATREGPRLIDWQYAGIGDPVEDLVCFLSPGLLTLYGIRPLALHAEDVLLQTYPDRDVMRRFERDRIAYHWRLAAYCLYRQESLACTNPPAARAYGRALEEEVDLILRLRAKA
ncbi:aminoglycoside phosphotransferase family protein [Roseibium hamelinense]|nr:aminoglycoside phosphotransferase family protein [Roseibium hamelinense]